MLFQTAMRRISALKCLFQGLNKMMKEVLSRLRLRGSVSKLAKNFYFFKKICIRLDSSLFY